jgi:hypothetical protein
MQRRLHPCTVSFLHASTPRLTAFARWSRNGERGIVCAVCLLGNDAFHLIIRFVFFADRLHHLHRHRCLAPIHHLHRHRCRSSSSHTPPPPPLQPLQPFLLLLLLPLLPRGRRTTHLLPTLPCVFMSACGPRPVGWLVVTWLPPSLAGWPVGRIGWPLFRTGRFQIRPLPSPPPLVGGRTCVSACRPWLPIDPP